MPKILKVIAKTPKLQKTGFFRKILALYEEQDKFTKMAIITMFLIVVVTPAVISTRLIFSPHAQDSTTFIATSGAMPVFSLTNYTNIQQPTSSAILSWTTSSPSKCKIVYWKDDIIQNIMSFFSVSPTTFYESNFSTAHTFVVPQGELLSNTTYNYKISATSKDGEEFTSHTYSFKTD